jgi:diguanylate cyclase (GGDEF)-like protein
VPFGPFDSSLSNDSLLEMLPVSYPKPWSCDGHGQEKLRSGAKGEHIEVLVRRVDTRQWWLWCSAMVVTLLAMAGIASFALPDFLSQFASFHAFFLNDTVRGLLSLVVLFNVYVVYEQVQINRIRNQVSEEFYKLAFLDPLTGLFNRRYIERWLTNEIARAQRHGSALTVVLFDLDAFKQVNDGYGHSAGDRVLQEFAERLGKATRGVDVVGRYGGDEFLAVLPECSSKGVQPILQRLDGLQAEANGEKLPFHYSAGWAEYLPGESIEALLKRADQSLYTRKRDSRKVHVPSPAMEPSTSN